MRIPLEEVRVLKPAKSNPEWGILQGRACWHCLICFCYLNSISELEVTTQALFSLLPKTSGSSSVQCQKGPVCYKYNLTLPLPLPHDRHSDLIYAWICWRYQRPKWTEKLLLREVDTCSLPYFGATMHCLLKLDPSNHLPQPWLEMPIMS